MPESFGKNLRKARKAKGLTVAGLAEKAKVTIHSIYYWERDDKLPCLYNAICVADALGVSLDWLAGRENK